MSLQYVKLYDVNEGLKARGTYGGPYLDRLERYNAETQRSVNENRAADYDPPIYGPETRLVTAQHLVENHSILEHPVQAWQVAVDDMIGRDVISLVSVDQLPVQVEIAADDNVGDI